MPTLSCPRGGGNPTAFNAAADSLVVAVGVGRWW